MTHARKSFSSVLAGFALALTAGLAMPAEAPAQSNEIRVLVAPLAVQDGVRERFGERVADRVRDRLKDFSGMRPIEKDRIEDALEQYQLEPSDMTAIEWRQLASRLDAQMLMVGTARRGGQGVQVEVRFVDPQSGDELPAQSFQVQDDGKDREAAQEIASGLEGQVEFQRSVVFCAEYLASDQLEDAARNCERALAVNPSSTRAVYLQGRIFMEQERWEEARENLGRVLDENPSNTDALQSLAFVETQLGNTDRAQALYREYLNFNPDDADVRLNVAFNLASAGAFAEAIEILQEGVERDSTNAALWEYLGNVALAKGTARESAATGAPAAPEGTAPQPGATPGRQAPEGSSVSDPEAVRLAVRAYDKVFELRGDEIEPAILTNVIAAHMELGDLEAALEFSERALERLRAREAGGTAASPAGQDTAVGQEDQAAQDETAGTGEDAEVPGRAEETTEQTLARVHDLRSTIYTRMDRFQQAVRELDRVLELEPEYLNARMRRGSLSLRAGNTDRALSDFREAIDRGQDPNAVAQNLFARGYQDYFQRDQFSTAIDMFRTAREFADREDLRQQINFFTAYSYYQMGAQVDSRNQQETCEPARRALNTFQQVLPLLNQSGSYQQQSQSQIREAVDVQVYRQEQIIRKSC